MGMKKEHPALAFLGDTVQATRRTVRGYVQATKLLWQASATYTLYSGALHVVQGISPPIQIWLLKVLIDRVTVAVQSSAVPV